MKRIGTAITYAVLGWILCGATMGTALALTSEPRALLIHLLAAPVLAAAVTVLYRRRPSPIRPLAWAALLLGMIALLDAVVVAWLLLGTFEMFASVIGIWIPFALIFTTSTVVGRLMDTHWSHRHEAVVREGISWSLSTIAQRAQSPTRDRR
jgi:hypothetical protein